MGFGSRYAPSSSGGWMSKRDYEEWTHAGRGAETTNEVKAQPEVKTTDLLTPSEIAETMVFGVEDLLSVEEEQKLEEDKRTPEELYEHMVAVDTRLMGKFHGWEQISPVQLADLKVGKWIVQTKFINYKTKQRRSLCMIKLTGKSGNTLSFENLKPRIPDPRYPFVKRTWNLSWSATKPLMEALIGSCNRQFYIKG